jgi:hypothetical protein
MDLLPRGELEKLVEECGGPCVSIFLPTHRTGTETQQDPIRLKNLLGEAREDLLANGLRSTEVDQILEPARELLADEVFWRYQSDGLAVFLSRNDFRSYRLPLCFEELAVVAGRYHVKPVLPLLTGDGEFYVLALSQNEVRLLRATRHSIGEVELQNVPGSLAAALNHEDTEKQLQFHTGTSGGRDARAAVFHGHEVDLKDAILRYFRQIDRGVREVLAESRALLVLVGVGYLLPIYREASTYPQLVKEGVTGNPEGLSEEEVHREAWAVVRPHFLKARREAVARYEQLAGTGQTSVDLREVVPAAYYGRVDVLFAAAGARRWGVFDPSTGGTRLHEEADFGDGDLLDFAAVQTLLNKGTVYILNSKDMPGGAAVASVLRY